MTIDNERLAKFEGRCRHDWVRTTAPMSPVLIFKCSICGKLAGPLGEPDELPKNPSYSTSPADRERLLEYLMKKEEMYWEFTSWTYNVKDNLSKTIVMHFVWLMVPPPDSNVPRWVSLLSEFLGMESVREKFGRKCELDCEVSCLSYKGACSGKIPAEWAKER